MKYKLLLLMLFMISACNSDPSVMRTVDPFIAVESAQRTAEAAQQDADYYGRQLTATAEAPLMAITQTAAAFEMQMQYAQATSQSAQLTETAAYTATAMAWTPTPAPTSTPNATSTMVAAQAIAQQTRIANDIERDNLNLQQDRITNTMKPILLYATGLALLLIAMMFGIALSKRQAVVHMPIDERGKPQPLLDAVEGTVIDPDRMANAVTSTRHADLRRLPAVTAERQDQVTQRAQEVDLMTRATRRTASPALPQLGTATMEQLQSNKLFPLPAWELAESWDGGSKLPYGLTADGLGLVDLAQYPHIATIGKTGSGKSRRFIRPFLAFALASGQRVVIMGKSADFWPFSTHPNATILPVRELTIAEEAKRYAMFLKAMIEEMNRRDKFLTDQRVSTWAIAGRENTLVVLDELGNALDMMPNEYAQTCYRYIRGLVKEGRKVGFNIVLSTQRAKGFRDILTQVGRAVFYVEDEQESRYALGMPGAEQLPQGYFYSKFGAQRLSGAFEPSDQEIVSFLVKRQIKVLEPLDWVQPLISSDAMEKLPEISETRLDDAVALPDPDTEQILSLHAQGKTPSAIVKEIWNLTAGYSWQKRKAQVEQVLATTTSTTTDPEMAQIGPVAA